MQHVAQSHRLRAISALRADSFGRAAPPCVAVVVDSLTPPLAPGIAVYRR
ncbi:hypothetical protein R2359_17350 [Mycobacteroides chelonae]|nr:hypothetical protein [Mycobacteroides chelonae]